MLIFSFVCVFKPWKLTLRTDVRLEIRDNVLSQETLTNGKIRKGLTRTLKKIHGFNYTTQGLQVYRRLFFTSPLLHLTIFQKQSLIFILSMSTS